jgi:hypothetical protein
VKATSELKDAEAKAAAAAFVESGQYAAGHGTMLLTGFANANAAVKTTSAPRDAAAKAAAAAFVESGQYAAGHGTKLLTGFANANAAVKATSELKDAEAKAAAEELVRSGRYAAGHGTFVATGKSNARRAAVQQAVCLTKAAAKNPQILQRCDIPACPFQVPCSNTHEHLPACVKPNDERGRVARWPNAGGKCSTCWKAANLIRE